MLLFLSGCNAVMAIVLLALRNPFTAALCGLAATLGVFVALA